MLCELLSKIGESLDKTDGENNKTQFNDCFILLNELSKLKEISSRIKVKLELVIALRKNKWKARREDEGPCKKEDIHKKIANETSIKLNGIPKVFSSPQQQPIRMMQRGKEMPGAFNYPTDFRRINSAPGHMEPIKNESKVPSFQTGVIVKRTTSVTSPSVSVSVATPTNVETKQVVEDDTISDEHIEEKLKGMMSDYLTSDDMDEVIIPLQELPKRAIARLIVIALDKYIDCNKSDMQKKLYSLLDGIANKGMFSGLTKLIEDAITSWEPFQTLWDYVIEYSKAPSLIGNILKLLITFNACTKTAIQESISNIRMKLEKENDEFGPSLEDFDKVYNDLLSHI